MDVMVLACTHFPLLRAELAAHFSSCVQLIDSGEAIARRVASLVKENTDETCAPIHRAIFTKACANIESLKPSLALFNMHHTDIIDV
jgi:glutamate racemase